MSKVKVDKEQIKIRKSEYILSKKLAFHLKNNTIPFLYIANKINGIRAIKIFFIILNDVFFV